ncbi:MAG TPA: amidohydrolase family protein, partial [Roseiarcus sp.]|nr:amidohydrolase family protein [Roseiarcus sp.]
MNQIVSGAKASTRPLLVKGGSVLSMDSAVGDLDSADILIVDGTIREVGPGIHVQDAEIIDATGHIVMPGFVDTHRHLWEGLIRNSLADGTLADYFRVVNGKFGPAYRPQDVYAGTLLSALGALDAGVTTVLDWAHVQNSPEHTDGSIAALRESGLRAVFG